MDRMHFQDSSSRPVVFLVPSHQPREIQKEYLDPFGIPYRDVEAIRLHFSKEKKKTPKKEMEAFITEALIKALPKETRYLLVANADYFKVLTGQGQAEANLGYVFDCLYGPWKVLYVPSYQGIFHNPGPTRTKIKQALDAFLDHVRGAYKPPGAEIFKFEAYPSTDQEISDWLDKLLAMDCDLSIDIETFDLKPHRAGIGTISFAWNKHEGIAFPVDYRPIIGATEAPFGSQVENEPVRILLRNFFQKYLKRSLYHNITFDVSILIYQLYMSDILDTPGLLKGMDILLRNWDCTKLITYLATNSCAGNKLGLKDQIQEFAGNYAQDEIADITKIPLPELLRYNLVDAMGCWYVEEKHWKTMIQDEQLPVYKGIFRPAVLDVIQMQLTGLPIDMGRVKEVKATLEKQRDDALSSLLQNPIVEDYIHFRNVEWVKNRNAILKRKREVLTNAKETFNPNSDDQVRELLFHRLKLPVIDKTDSGLPSTNKRTIEALLNHTKDPKILSLLQGLKAHSEVAILLSTFIPAMEDAIPGPDGWHYMVGNFNLGGTISGRLSSSKPNLQNIPARGILAFLIKSCFKAPSGWLLVGLDFNALEDRISALTTKDPAKLKVYIDGFDGHSLRAYTYFKDQMPDINPDSVESINSIAEKYPDLRDSGKAPTFAKTYQGTWRTLMDRCGFSKAFAIQISDAFDDLYRTSIEWVQKKLDQASIDGYVTVAFGHRVRTPRLAQVIRGTSKTPYEAEAEGRSAGNALGQSWCMLNSRAASEFLGKVRTSAHKHWIRPCAQIHDASYYLVKDDLPTLHFANTHLVAAAEWQDHPDIAHNEVHLGGTLEIYWPTWTDGIKVPNYATEEQIVATIQGALHARQKHSV